MLFLVMDIRYFIPENMKDYDSQATLLVGTIMQSSVGYLHTFLVIGLVLTGLFIFGLSCCVLKIEDRDIIARGRIGFILNSFAKISKDAFIISMEFVGVLLAFTYIYFDAIVLSNYKTILCLTFYTIVLVLYFLFLGSIYLLLQVLLNFNSYVLLLEVGTVFLFNGLGQIGLRISPVYSCDFIVSWFANNTLDTIDYLSNALLTISLSIFAVVAAIFIFERRDIIIDVKSDR